MLLDVQFLKIANLNQLPGSLAWWLRWKEEKIAYSSGSRILWSIWKARNMACFQKVCPTDPISMLKQTCYWIDHWKTT
jgi:hypothetical protein